MIISGKRPMVEASKLIKDLKIGEGFYRPGGFQNKTGVYVEKMTPIKVHGTDFYEIELDTLYGNRKEKFKADQSVRLVESTQPKDHDMSEAATIKLGSQVKILAGAHKGKVGTVSNIRIQDDEDEFPGEEEYTIKVAGASPRYLSQRDVSAMNESTPINKMNANQLRQELENLGFDKKKLYGTSLDVLRRKLRDAQSSSKKPVNESLTSKGCQSGR